MGKPIPFIYDRSHHLKRILANNRWILRVFFLLLFSLFLQRSNSQTIAIDNANFQTGIFGQGSTIAVPITITGCFKWNNSIRLFLCSPANTNGTIVGTFTKNGFYSTFVNATIANGTAARTDYYFEARTTTPITTSNKSTVFEIKNIPAPITFINTTSANRRLIDSLYYGYCSGNPPTIRPVTLVNQSTSGSVSTVNYKDENSGVVTNLPLAIGGSADVNLDVTFYTMLAKAEKDGVISTRSFFLVNTTHNLSLQTSGEQKACLPDALAFSVNTNSTGSGIGTNFPGTYYIFDWGDTRPNDTLTNCEILATNGTVSHAYTDVSCGKSATVGGTTYANAFPVDIKYINPFKNSFNSNNCDEPSIATFARIFRKPQANFVAPDPACVNTLITFLNTTVGGIAQAGNACTTTQDAQWFVDGNFVSNDIDLQYTFTTTGTHTIRLMVENTSCAPSEVTKTICVEPKPVPDFKVNGLDSVGACAPVAIVTTNLTNTNICRSYIWKWQVYNDSTGALVSPASGVYTITPNDTAFQPSFNFNIPGRYSIRLTVSSSCTPAAVVSKIVNVLKAAGVTLPTIKNFCGNNQTIDFGASPYKPTYNSNVGNETYTWSVTGGAYSFANSTSTTSKFPVILFNDYGTYTVTVQFTNSCGVQTASAPILFSQPVTADAGVDSLKLCYDQLAINLNGSVTGPVDSIKWTTNGTGTFNPANNTTSVYTLSAADRNAGSLLLIVRAYAKQPGGCPDVRDTIRVKVYPRNFGVDTTKNICSESSVSYTPRSSVAASTFTWTSSVITGTVTGNTASGNGTITDNLVNTSSSTDGIVKYVVTPSANGCTGEPYTLTVNVKAKPVLTVTPSSATICSGDSANISVGSSVSNSNYTWTSFVTAGTVSGNSNKSNQSITAIKDRLINTGLTDAMVTYKIVASGPTFCLSDTQSVIITVSAGATIANAGADQKLCAQTQTTLTGNTPVVGTGQWTQTGGPASTIVNPASPTTNITGLVVDSIYRYVWKISSSGSTCGSSNDTVYIFVRSVTTQASAGADVSTCVSSGNTYTLQGNQPRSNEAASWTIISTTMSPAPTLSSATNPNALINGLRSGSVVLKWSITNDAPGCASTSDTIVINISGNVTPANAGTDQTLCNQSAAVLAGNNPGTSSGVWSVITGSNAVVTNPSQFNSAVTGLSVGVNKFVWTITNNVCPPSSDTVSINVLADVVNVIDTAAKAVCAGQPVTINGGVPTGGNGSYQYQWQQSADKITFNDIAGATSQNLTLLPAATAYYRRIVRSSPCIKFSDTALVIVQPGLTNNIIANDQSICAGRQPAAINGQDPTGGNGFFTYRWQSSLDNNNWTDIIGAIAKDYTPGVLMQTTYFRRLVSTTLCNGPQANTSNSIKITINPDAKADFNPTVTKGCVPFNITPAIINLTPDNNSVGEYRWYVNGNYIGSGQSFPGFTVNNPADSITIKLVTISKFGCKNDSTQRGFITVERPVPSYTQTDTVGCGPLGVTFTNTTPNALRYNYLWNFGNGQTSTVTQPGLITFATNPNNTDTVYIVTMKALSSCDTIVTTSYVRVKSKPKALFTPDKSEGCSPMKVTFSNTSRGTNVSYVWNFGDGTPPLSTNAATVQHTFNVGAKDTFKVRLIGMNNCGSDTLTYAIVVNPNSIRIDFAVNGNERFGCAPHTVKFINNTTGANSFTWTFGDGTTLNTTKGIDTISHTYTAAGNYNVLLFASNSCNDTTDTEPITVQVKPSVSFTAPFTACVTDTVRFTNTSSNGISNTWSFGDGTTSFVRSPSKVFTAPGTYRILLTGSNVFPQGFSCIDSAFSNIIVRDTLKGDFTVSDSVSGCLPFTVNFKNLNRPSETTWIFGDGSTATGDSVTHTYTTRGSFVVKMNSRAGGGCIFSSTKNIVVNTPTGTLSYNSGYVCTGNAVRFEIKNGNASQYRFIFDDGDSLTTSNPLAFHQYTKPRIYIPYAYLIEGNCRIKLFVGDTVKADIIKAGFRRNTQFNCGVTTVQFTDTSNAFFGIRSRQWSFGDGTTSSLQNPSKTYNNGGLYIVHLQVTGASGCTDTTTAPVDIAVRSFPAGAIGGDTVACTGQVVNLAALVQSKDSIANLSWTFGNGITVSGKNVTALYNVSGIYTVRLITTTTFGCADSAYKTIKVNASPIVNAGTDVRICRGQSVQLQAFGATTWQWLPLQDLSCSACANPVANPTLSTQYVVRGTNNLNCSVTDTVLVNVVQPFKLTVSANDTICIGDQTQLFASGANNYLWNPVAGLSNGAIANPIANPTTTTQYRVIGSDPYNCFADTGYVSIVVGNYPTVNLGTGTTVVAGTTITMNPILTNGPFKNYTWTPAIDLSCYNCKQPVATINNNISYKLEAENIYGCKASDTIIYKVTCEEASQVYIPNAFSPDGDGLNDVFMVRGRGIASVKYFRVFNRWGQLVFEKNNFNANDPQQGWDGRVNGITANPDVYVYTAEMICTAGSTFIRKGNVTLVR